MIDRIRKGRNVARLLAYLFGPGKSDEHENPHLVAGWRDPVRDLEPPVLPSGRRDIRPLAGLLNTPLAAAGRLGKAGTVWHCVLSAAPADRLLTDAEWNAIASEFMHQMRLACTEDPGGVRWVTVRHGLSSGGIDHIHIAATLARQDGRLPSVHNDFIRARRACRDIEVRFGLTVTAPADRTAAVRPGRGETERARRSGRAESARITLRRRVQEAAAVAVSEEDFLACLAAAGTLIRLRRGDRDPAQITGYAVALPGHTAGDGQAIWYGGGKLAPDLTLPKLLRRWERAGNAEHRAVPHGENLSPHSARAALRSAAVQAAERARDEEAYFGYLATQDILVRHRHSDQNPDEITGYALALPGHTDADGNPVWYSAGKLSPELSLPRLRNRWHGTTGTKTTPQGPDPSERRAIWDDLARLTADGAAQFRVLVRTDLAAAADVAQATGDALRISARVIRGVAGRDLHRAADGFDRAAREAYGAIPRRTTAGDAIRTATRLLYILGAARTGTAGALNQLIVNLAELAAAAAELRRVQDRAHQAEAARATAKHLRHLARRTAPGTAFAARSSPDRHPRPPSLAGQAIPPIRPPQQTRTRPGPQSAKPARRPDQQRRPHGPAP